MGSPGFLKLILVLVISWISLMLAPSRPITKPTAFLGMRISIRVCREVAVSAAKLSSSSSSSLWRKDRQTRVHYHEMKGAESLFCCNNMWNTWNAVADKTNERNRNGNPIFNEYISARLNLCGIQTNLLVKQVESDACKGC